MLRRGHGTGLRMGSSGAAPLLGGARRGCRGCRRGWPAAQLAVLDQVGIERQVAPHRAVAAQRWASATPSTSRSVPAGIAGGQQQVRPRPAPARSRRRAGSGSAAPGRARSRTCTQASALARSTMRGWSAARPGRRHDGGGGRRRGGSRQLAAAAALGGAIGTGGDRPPLRLRRRAAAGCGRHAAAARRRHRLLGQRRQPRRHRRAGLRRQPALAGQAGTSRHRRRRPAPRRAAPPRRPARRAPAPGPGRSARSSGSPSAASALKRRAISSGSRPSAGRIGAQEAERVGVARQVGDAGRPPAPRDSAGGCAAPRRCPAATSRRAPARPADPHPRAARAAARRPRSIAEDIMLRLFASSRSALLQHGDPVPASWLLANAPTLHSVRPHVESSFARFRRN